MHIGEFGMCNTYVYTVTVKTKTNNRSATNVCVGGVSFVYNSMKNQSLESTKHIITWYLVFHEMPLAYWL